MPMSFGKYIFYALIALLMAWITDSRIKQQNANADTSNVYKFVTLVVAGTMLVFFYLAATNLMGFK